LQIHYICNSFANIAFASRAIFLVLLKLPRLSKKYHCALHQFFNFINFWRFNMSSIRFRITATASALAAASLISVGFISVASAQTSPDDHSQKAGPLAASPEALQALQNQINKRSLAKSSAARHSSKIQPLVMEMLESPMVAETEDKRIDVLVKINDRTAIEAMKSTAEFGQMQNEPGLDNMVQMRVTAAELANLANAPAVQKINASISVAGGNNVGSKTSAGDVLLKARAARDQFRVNGSGKSVCVISNGVSGLAASKASGDLPANIEVCKQNPGVGSEGTAMLEIVHDLAPGAKLAFCSGNNNFLGAIRWSTEQANGGRGCDVIVDDVYLLDIPRFQISDESEYINKNVKQKGITYVTSAGNRAQDNYRAVFLDADFSRRTPLAGFHDFGLIAGQSSEIGFPVFVQANGESAVFLQWSEPFGKASSDFVMKAVLAGGKDIRAANSPFTLLFDTDSVQNGTGDPLESVYVRNKTNQQQVYFLTIKRKTGNSPVEISMINNGNLGSVFASNFRNTTGSIFAHSGAAGAISVGAADASSPGLNQIEYFSSRGMVKTIFDNAGNPQFNIEAKPDVTATDGVAVTGNGGFPKIFFGTSASAPHVAAIAALIKNISPNANVASVLKFSADDRGAPGQDDVWGFGLVNAQRALQNAPFLGGVGY
jgi:subtilisin family serine protease